MQKKVFWLLFTVAYIDHRIDLVNLLEPGSCAAIWWWCAGGWFIGADGLTDSIGYERAKKFPPAVKQEGEGLVIE